MTDQNDMTQRSAEPIDRSSDHGETAASSSTTGNGKGRRRESRRARKRARRQAARATATTEKAEPLETHEGQALATAELVSAIDTFDLETTVRAQPTDAERTSEPTAIERGLDRDLDQAAAAMAQAALEPDIDTVDGLVEETQAIVARLADTVEAGPAEQAETADSGDAIGIVEAVNDLDDLEVVDDDAFAGQLLLRPERGPSPLDALIPAPPTLVLEEEPERPRQEDKMRAPTGRRDRQRRRAAPRSDELLVIKLMLPFVIGLCAGFGFGLIN